MENKDLTRDLTRPRLKAWRISYEQEKQIVLNIVRHQYQYVYIRGDTVGMTCSKRKVINGFRFGSGWIPFVF